MHGTQKDLFTQVIKRALATPLSLGLLAMVSLLTLTSPELWAVIMAGIVAELAVLQNLVRSERFVRDIRESAAEQTSQLQAERAREVRSLADPVTAERIVRIQQLQGRLLRECDAPGVKALTGGDALGVSRHQVAALLDQCLRLAERRRQLEAYLQETNPSELQRQAVQIQEKWERAHDDVARQLYEHAMRQKRSELENCAAIQQAVARIDGQLEAIECSFGNLLGKVVRLKSIDATHSAGARDQLCRDLSELMAGVAALEQSVDETLSQ
jgi:hypothetical protein